ncbi:urea amidolyase associated protein UAAP2 [Thiomicrorhabdus sediminis]|uniref:Urea carboxylase-associated family protein n=1 Tax=Thiomicrorhabdus sediminis TaxID=2580412 RepID=A0A4V1HHR4_9GAMM|nr:urea amidolyase associated protein UAAP2 [Thiomicrorhabdus sediminis]QCU89933.1 urea carboxylase-associated family protein [Thiomicrorhabdus sediminis]
MTEKFDESRIVYREVVEAGKPWMHEVKAGQFFRIVDLEGNEAVDTLFYNATDHDERYSATDTIREQGNIYLTTGSVLRSNLGNPMLTIVDDTCGRHDTIGGACSAESNTVRYAIEKRHMHSCRDSFLMALGSCSCNHDKKMSKDDLSSNINFFMNVPVTPDGHLDFDDGISAPGRYVEMQAHMDTLILVSNCPQLNNPCNGYNPTPVEMVIWE